MGKPKSNKFMTIYEGPFGDGADQDVLDNIQRGFRENPASNLNRIKGFFLEMLDIEDSEISLFIDKCNIISREEVLNVLNGKFSIKDLPRDQKIIWLDFWNLLTKKMVMEVIDIDLNTWKEINLEEQEKRVRDTINYIVEQAIMGKEWKGQKPLPKKLLSPEKNDENLEPQKKDEDEKINKPRQKELKESDFKDLKYEILNGGEADLVKNKVLEDKISGFDMENQKKFINYLNNSFFEILNPEGNIDKSLTKNRFGNESPLILLDTENSIWTFLTSEQSRSLIIEMREFKKKPEGLWRNFEVDIIPSDVKNDEDNAFTFYIDYEDLTISQKKEFKNFYNQRLNLQNQKDKNNADIFIFKDEDTDTLEFIESTRASMKSFDSTALPDFIEEYADCNLADLRKVKGWIHNIYGIEVLLLKNKKVRNFLSEKERLMKDLRATFSQTFKKIDKDKILKEIQKITVEVNSLRNKILKNDKKIKESRNLISKNVVSAARKNLRTIILNYKRNSALYSHAGVSSEMIELNIENLIRGIEIWDPLKDGGLSENFLKILNIILDVIGERIGHQFEDTSLVPEAVKQLNFRMRKGSRQNRVFDFDPELAGKIIIEQPRGYHTKSLADQVREQNHHSNYATFLLTLAQSRYFEGTSFRDKAVFMSVRNEFLDEIFDLGDRVNRQGKCMVLTAMMHYPDLTVWKDEVKWDYFRDSLFKRGDYNEIELGSIIEAIFYYGWEEIPKVKSFLQKYQSRWQFKARKEHLHQNDVSSEAIINRIKDDIPEWTTSHEVYIKSSSSFVDILIKTTDGRQLIVELDGGSHYYTDQNNEFILDKNGDLIEKSKSLKKKRLLLRSGIPVLHIMHSQNLIKKIPLNPDAMDIALGHDEKSGIMEVPDIPAIRDVLSLIWEELAKQG